MDELKCSLIFFASFASLRETISRKDAKDAKKSEYALSYFGGSNFVLSMGIFCFISLNF